MASDYWQIDLLGASAGTTVRIEPDGGTDHFDFGDSYAPQGVSRIDLGSTWQGQVAATAWFTGPDGLARQVVLVGEIEVARGSQGADDIRGSDRGDWLYGDALYGAVGGNDTLHGRGGADVLVGVRGDDHLFGGVGDDVVEGGLGRDRLFGGGGHDRLYGGAGDRLHGGSGADRFIFGRGDSPSTAAPARIVDFPAAENDRIDLRQVDGDTTTMTHQDLHLVADFTGAGAELRLRPVERGILVEADTNHDGTADFALLVQGVTTLTMADFLL